MSVSIVWARLPAAVGHPTEIRPYSETRCGSIRIPGPMVDEIDTFLKYRPLADDGFRRSSSSIAAERLTTNAEASKLAFPMGRCTLPYRSVRNSTLPPLNLSLIHI